MPVSIAGPETGVRRRRMTVRYLSLPVISTLGFGAGARVWAIGALLLLPLYFFYVVHFTIAGAPGTGFLQYDQAYYMAIARAYFADGGFSPVYGLPFSPDPATPRLYFQPLTLALGIAWELTGGDPGILYMLAGLLLALCCARVMIALYGELVTGPRLAVALGLICFFWGGGCLALAGYCRALINGEPPIGHLFDFDPFAGFWFLNLGRNLIFTTEAFYHLLFLGAVLLVLRRRFAAALLCVAVLSASHAFSGLQLIAVLGTWSMLDRLVGRADRPPVFFVAALIALAALHIGYYLVFLDHMSEEHRSLHQQWALAWVLPWSSALAAYGPVAALAATALVSRRRRRHRPGHSGCCLCGSASRSRWPITICCSRRSSRCISPAAISGPPFSCSARRSSSALSRQRRAPSFCALSFPRQLLACCCWTTPPGSCGRPCPNITAAARAG
jgi:hypothetical protein